VTVLRVPYHLDEYLPDLDLPLEPARVGPARTITAELPPGGDTWAQLAALYQRVADAVARAAASGTRPVVVSGDCTTSLGIVAGLQRAGLDPGIVWFDAHGDVQTPETTASGYLGGMPLRLLAGYRPELIAGPLGLRPVPERRIVLAGARDLDPPEAAYLASAAIARTGVAELDPAALPAGPLYVHLDLDVIDPAALPGLQNPAPGGAGPADIAAALAGIAATGRVAAVGVACTWRPGQDDGARIAPYLTDVLLNL
jgi:arginase